MRSFSRHGATSLGAALLLAGFVVLFLTWRSVAATVYIPAQFAYALSGGLSGIGLIGVALAVLSAHTTRLLGSCRAGCLEDILDELLDAVAAVEQQVALGTGATASPARDTSAFAVEVPASSNGNGPTDEGDAHIAWRPDVLVIPGAKTFHRAGCRTVRDPERALRVAVDQASDAGLRPCQLCNDA